MISDLDIAKRALRSLDLTDLNDTCTPSAIDALCAKALDPRGPVAAVCVWPQFVSQSVAALKGSSIGIATVVNFPSGDEDVARVCDAVAGTLADGATEIDLVLPYRALQRGAPTVAANMVRAVRDVIGSAHRLKVILETGELADPLLIETASRLAIDAGADFIKTSTGKTAISATPQAAEIMLTAIKKSGRKVGLKPSGGIRTLADARVYIELADRIMGEGWATPATFRIGASSVYDALIAMLEGKAATTAVKDY